MALKPLLKQLAEDDAFLCPPVEPLRLDAVVEALEEAELPPLPADYAQLLALADGLAWNGVMLYGAAEHEAPAGSAEAGTIVPDLAAANAEFAERDAPETQLLLGAADEDLFVWDSDLQAYAILDSTDLQVMDSYTDIATLLDAVIDSRM